MSIRDPGVQRPSAQPASLVAELNGNVGTGLRLPPDVSVGWGKIAALGAIVSARGRRAFICSDASVAQTAFFHRAMDSLEEAQIERRSYLESPADVPLEAVEECVRIASSQPVDVVVGIGGGSSLDMAKLTALALAHPGPLRRYYGEGAVPGPCVPMIAIPTTAGTGSEVSPVAVLSDPNVPMKVGIASEHVVPSVALCDPQATLTCPPTVTAYAGFDALVHALEAYTAGRRPEAWLEYPGQLFRGKSLFSDLHALTAIQLIHASLEQAVGTGDDQEARSMVALGSLCAGIAFSHAGTAGAHALQYPIGSLTGTPHGLGVGLLAPFVIDYIRPAVEQELTTVGRAIGVVDSDTPISDGAERTIDEIERLARAVGLPKSLVEIGVRETDLEGIADDALTITRLLRNSPRPLDRDALRAILSAAWRGERVAN